MIKMTVPRLTEGRGATLQTDTEPYLLKQTPQGDRELLSLVGGTVAWNQLAPTLDAFEQGTAVNTLSVVNGVATVTTEAANNNTFLVSRNFGIINSHKYLTLYDAKGDTFTSASYAMVSFYGTATSAYNLGGFTSAWKRYCHVFNATATESVSLRVGARTTDTQAMVYEVKNVNIIDLTQMFGSTIADYLNGLGAENALAWLQNLGFFTKDYYAYDAGSLLSVKTSGHVIKDANDNVVATYPLSNIELRGIPKLVDNQLQYDGDRYESSGAVTRKYGVQNLGALSWTAQTGYFQASFTACARAASNNAPANILCPMYETVGASQVSSVNNSIGRRSNGSYLRCRNDSYSDAGAFKTAMDGVYLVYELATPTTETADPYTSPQTVKVTEQFVDERTVPMPVGNVSEYYNATFVNKVRMHANTDNIVIHMGVSE